MAGNGGRRAARADRARRLDPGDEVLMPHPAFEPYGTEATLSGATVV